jgi:hypothetical protein
MAAAQASLRRGASQTGSANGGGAPQRRGSSSAAAPLARTSVFHTGKTQDPLKDRAMLRSLLDIVLGPDLGKLEADTEFLRTVQRWQTRAKAVEGHWLFSLTVTVTIVVVGLVIGLDTDDLMACERFHLRNHADSDVGSDAEVGAGGTVEATVEPGFCTPSTFSVALGYLSQLIFTAELCTKVAACGAFPER